MPIIATYNHDQPSDAEKKILVSLVFTSDMEEEEREDTLLRINGCTDYKEYQKLQYSLEVRQQSIYDIPNPSQTDILNHLRKLS
jgi:hypothetical protein